MTTTLVEVVYPSTSAFSGTGQLDMGPFFVPDVNWLLRLEVHGKINFQGTLFGASSVNANFQLWAAQWVTHGSAPANIVTAPDGAGWLLRQQTGTNETHDCYAPSTDTAAMFNTYPLEGDWAGQVAIGTDIDLWLSLRPPTGVSISNQNVFASMRFWWI